ncbi:MAG: DUF4114 domain-containing protein [Candidatus Hydrogenedentes bacterium]|nr:DUF4114 domain-containing protein [Candidatus Hydrogenedentota bacterium]
MAGSKNIPLRRRRRTHQFSPRWVAAAVLPLAIFLVWFLFNGSNEAPMQTGQRDYGIPAYQPVQRAGSDFNAWLFSRFMLPDLITLANKEYTHSAVVSHFEKLALDPARLKLMEESRVRVYFIGEGSGYVNALGVNFNGLGTDEGDPRILFPNANTSLQLDGAAKMMSSRIGRLFRSKLGKRKPEAPLRPGDFVDLGRLPAGTQLNFFLIAFDGQGHNVYSVLKERNPDRIDHMVAMAVEGTSYLLVSFEDMYKGGDADYEDCVFAVEMSMDNVAALIGKMDPWRRIKQVIKWSVICTVVFGGPTATLVIRRRIRRKRLKQAYDAASHALRQSRPRDAVALIRQVKEQADDKTWLALSRLEVEALETARDPAELGALYEEAPEAFSDHETASLQAGKAQIAADRLDTFEPLRASWRERGDHPAEWLVLESEMLERQEKAGNARSLLEEKRFDGASEALRRARLALVQVDAAEAAKLADSALALAPHHPEVLRCRALWYESLGQWNEARNAWHDAHQAEPENLFIRDGMAEFCRKQGRYEAALKLWHDALAPPTLDIIWTKFLFWRRVACPALVNLDSLPSPPGELNPLIAFMRALPPDRFWDPVAFEAVAHEHVALYDRQEVFWLRLLHALHTGNEAEALALVNLSGFGGRSWHLVLERGLVRILTYRRAGYAGVETIHSAACTSAVPEFFMFLDQMAGCAQGEPPDWFLQLLESPNSFAAACAAAGWKEAARRLARPDKWPPGVPDSLRGPGA